jgi:hypothetical protein
MNMPNVDFNILRQLFQQMVSTAMLRAATAVDKRQSTTNSDRRPASFPADGSPIRRVAARAEARRIWLRYRVRLVRTLTEILVNNTAADRKC